MDIKKYLTYSLRPWEPGCDVTRCIVSSGLINMECIIANDAIIKMMLEAG